MPQFANLALTPLRFAAGGLASVGGAIQAGATYAGASVGGFFASITGSTAIGGAVSNLVYYGSYLAVYTGRSAATAPRVPQ